MAKVLVLFAHPALEKSRVHAALIKQLKGIRNLYFHDLYQTYPDFDIDVKNEQQLLLEHDIIVWQHPFYWYSAPALIKQWQDLVLEHNWAYGSEGKMLTGKKITNVISCGGSREAYSKTGKNRFTIPELLRPFEQTAYLCRMTYLPPFVIHATHTISNTDIDLYANQYTQLLKGFTEDRIPQTALQEIDYMNDLILKLYLN